MNGIETIQCLTYLLIIEICVCYSGAKKTEERFRVVHGRKIYDIRKNNVMLFLKSKMITNKERIEMLNQLNSAYYNICSNNKFFDVVCNERLCMKVHH